MGSQYFSHQTLWGHSTQSEISMRDEFQTLMRGSSTEQRVGRHGLLRRLLRDSNTRPVLCECRELGSKSHSRMHICPRCLNMGYKWIEEWVMFHKLSGLHGSRRMHSMEQTKEPGDIYEPKDVFYIEHWTQPTIMDAIIEVNLDQEGNVITPVTRSKFHDIRAIEEFRMDHGRSEFWQCSCSEITIGYFGQPLLTREPMLGELP